MHKSRLEKKKKFRIKEMLLFKESANGENSQIPYFGKICSKLVLFRKYLAIYHFFSTRISQNRVLNSTRVQ